eukprot:TRINITY_DN7660_c0_g2_i1.p1 TRINITY_DN7660_c0_g2~~TRINITY_DN7660_c0_g2_i1.p1  ORF type:complete len:1902 (+),score=434.36 TRINITY_DN7660_c0_g2_i1:127-5832(+)
MADEIDKQQSEFPENRYWVPDAEDVWTQADLKYTRDGQASFGRLSGGLLELPEKQVSTLQRVHPVDLTGADDVCSLPSISEGALLHTLRTRYGRQQIYTHVERVLIALNPFASLPIYSSEHLDRYSSAEEQSQLADLPPHIYGLSRNAVFGVLQGKGDHIVLISGESGAGKTESAKLILSFVAEAVHAKMQTNAALDPGTGEGENLTERILRNSPIFEAFGNAMTVRNNNSSRFGKWVDIHFSSAGQIQGCSLEHYLLETTRVCGHAAGERSYHIFYMLVKARQQFDYLKLKRDVKDYRYLQAGEAVAPGIDDAQCLAEVLDAFKALGFPEDLQKQIVRVVAGVLTCGNIEFKDGTSVNDGSCQVTDEAAARQAADLLGVDAIQLAGTYIYKTLSVGGSEVKKNLSETEARIVRDTLSQLIYGRLFEWMVRHMNMALRRGSKEKGTDDVDPSPNGVSDPSMKSLGVLDVAGFESFDINSLEQLLINLTNEHLQMSFNKTVIMAEVEFYAAEGIDVSVNFLGNVDCLELLDGKGGVLDFLDEEGNLPKGTDSAFVSKVEKAYGKHPRLIVSKFGGGMSFGVRHFAAEVVYKCDGFLEKNTARPPQAAAALLKSSQLTLVQELGEAVEKATVTASAGAKAAKKPKSASADCRASLRSLMTKIEGAQRHYVRCIKPNSQKKPDIFHSPMVMEQLRFSGILEAVHIRQRGFSTRVKKADFTFRYRCIVLEDLRRKGGRKMPALSLEQLVDALRDILGATKVPKDSLVIGKTLVFMRQAVASAVEGARSAMVGKSAVRVQSVFRGWSTRRRVCPLIPVHRRLRQWLQRVQPPEVKKKVGGRLNRAGIGTSITQATAHALAPRLLGASSSAEPSVLLATAHKALAELREALKEVWAAGIRNNTAARADACGERLQQEVQALSALEPLYDSDDLPQIQACLEGIHALGLPEPVTLLRRAAKLEVQLPLVEAMRSVISGRRGEITEAMQEEDLATEHVQRVLQEVEAADLGKRKSEWLPGLNGAELYEELLLWVQMAREQREKLEAERRAVRERLVAELQGAADECDAFRLNATLAEARKQYKAVSQEDMKPFEALVQQLRSDEAFLLERLDAELQRPVGECNENRLTNLVTLVRLLLQDAARQMPLKQVGSWKGHRRSITSAPSMSEGGYGEQGGMLQHSSLAIADALTTLPTDADGKRAVQNFRDIRICMGDRQAQDCQRKAARDAMLDLARSADQGLRDEVYLQMLKQVTCNPSARSAQTGWRLLELLCLSAAPSSQSVAAYVRLFLRLTTLIGPPTVELAATTSVADMLNDQAGSDHARDCFLSSPLTGALIADAGSEASSQDVCAAIRACYAAAKAGQSRGSTASAVANSFQRRRSKRASIAALAGADAAAIAAAAVTSAAASAERCLAALEKLSMLPRIQGHLWKKTPALLRMRTPFDLRYFRVDDMRLLWWKTAGCANTPEAFSPSGGHSCKGIVNFLADDCEVIADEPGTAGSFSLRPTHGTWSREAVKRGGGDRIFNFVTEDSEHTWQEWVDVLSAQIIHAKMVRSQRQAFERVPTLSRIIREAAVPVSIRWMWADAGVLLGRSNPLRWSKSLDLDGACDSLAAYLRTPERHRPVALDVSVVAPVTHKTAPRSLDVSEEVVASTLLEAMAIIEELQLAEDEQPPPSPPQQPAQELPPQPHIPAHEANGTAAQKTNGTAAAHDPGLQPRGGSIVSFEGGADATFEEGDEVWFLGQRRKLACGDELAFGTKGLVVRISQRPPATANGALSQATLLRYGVRFQGLPVTVSCPTRDLSKQKPGQPCADSLKVGDSVWYAGAAERLPDGRELSHGHYGRVVGARTANGRKSASIRFQSIAAAVDCDIDALLVQKPPDTSQEDGMSSQASEDGGAFHATESLRSLE